MSRFFLGDTVHELGKPEPVGTVLDAHRESKLGYTLEVHWHRSADQGGDFVNFQHPDDLEPAERPFYLPQNTAHPTAATCPRGTNVGEAEGGAA